MQLVVLFAVGVLRTDRRTRKACLGLRAKGRVGLSMTAITRENYNYQRVSQARFQQKQLQEKEQKLLQLYDQQQQRAYQVAQRGSSGSNGSGQGSSTVNHHHQIVTRTSSSGHMTSTSQATKVKHLSSASLIYLRQRMERRIAMGVRSIAPLLNFTRIFRNTLHIIQDCSILSFSRRKIKENNS